MKFLAAIVFVLFSFDAFAYGDANSQVIRVSIIQLISTPEKYHNKMVRVIGAARLEFEGNEICLSKDDLEFGNAKNCLWLSLNIGAIGLPNESKLLEFNGKFVLIEGTFNMKNTGHMSMNSGAIEDVWRYQLWEK